jgi:hypothetical protein
MPSFSDHEYANLQQLWRRQGVKEGRFTMKIEMGHALDQLIEMTDEFRGYRFPIWEEFTTRCLPNTPSTLADVRIKTIELTNEQLRAIRILLCGPPERKS